MCGDVIAITTAGFGEADLNFAVSVVGLEMGNDLSLNPSPKERDLKTQFMAVPNKYIILFEKYIIHLFVYQ